MIRKPEAGKMEGNDLPNSSASSAGVTENVLGGYSMADLKKGYCELPEAPMMDEDFVDLFATRAGGFLGRAEGWER